MENPYKYGLYGLYGLYGFLIPSLFEKTTTSLFEIFPTPERSLPEPQFQALGTPGMDFEGAALRFQAARAIWARIPRMCRRRML